jgi:transposase
MLSMVHHMTIIYVTLADFFDNHPQLLHWRNSNHWAPAFSDAEVLTLAFMQSYFQTPTLKRTYLLVRANDPKAFPHLPSYQQWLARLHKLAPLVTQILAATTPSSDSQNDYYVLDSKPIPVCLPIRNGRVLLLRDEGAYFGKNKKGWYFGFKLHLIRNRGGHILNAILTPANYDDREVGLALMAHLPGGFALADLGYQGWEIKELLAEETGILLITRADAPQKRGLISTLRQAVETTFSQLWSQFIDRVYSRYWLGLWNTIMLKLISHQLRQSGLLAV